MLPPVVSALIAFVATLFRSNTSLRLENFARSYWIPGSWHVRMVYTDAIPFHDP